MQVVELVMCDGSKIAWHIVKPSELLQECCRDNQHSFNTLIDTAASCIEPPAYRADCPVHIEPFVSSLFGLAFRWWLI